MDFIERTKLENEEKFKKMVTKYQIPKKYNDASKCFFSSKIAKLKLYSPKVTVHTLKDEITKSYLL